MKVTANAGGIIQTDNDYGYIQVFIDFLKQIVAMIQKLFNKQPVDE